MRNRQIRMGQKFLFEVMEALGYSPDKDGICFGIAMMGLQAILTQEVHVLDARLETSSYAPIKALCTNPNPDLLAFFDGVTLYQNPLEFSHLLIKNKNKHRQMTLPAQSLLQPSKLSSMVKINAFSGLYSQTELTDYFKSLHPYIETETRPFAILLTSVHHAITLGFDHTLDSWILIDANQLPYRYFKVGQEALLAQLISPDSTDTNFIGLTSIVYCAKADVEFFQKQINEWKNVALTNTLNVTREKANQLDIHGTNWLYIAIENDEPNTVQALMQFIQSAFVKQEYEEPLYLAAKMRKCQALAAMLKIGINPNCLSHERNSQTALHLAIRAKDLFLVELLTAFTTIDLTVKDSCGYTPLELARKKFLPDNIMITHLIEYEKQLAALEKPPTAKRKKMHEEISDELYQHPMLFNDNKENRINMASDPSCSVKPK